MAMYVSATKGMVPIAPHPQLAGRAGGSQKKRERTMKIEVWNAHITCHTFEERSVIIKHLKIHGYKASSDIDKNIYGVERHWVTEPQNIYRSVTEQWCGDEFRFWPVPAPWNLPFELPVAEINEWGVR